MRTRDGTEQNYPFETGSLTADTWTKVTKTIIGNSNLTFDTNNGEGVQINIAPFWGTNNTGSVSLNAWGAYSGSTRTPDNTSTWYTTNDATFEITGVQLELGSVATDFEHRSYGEELALCQRYFHQQGRQGSSGYENFFVASAHNAGYARGVYYLPTSMRAFPSLVASGDWQTITGITISSLSVSDGGGNPAVGVEIDTGSGMTVGYSYLIRSKNDVDAYLQFDAEL